MSCSLDLMADKIRYYKADNADNTIKASLDLGNLK
jgi:hypothetical protein